MSHDYWMTRFSEMTFNEFEKFAQTQYDRVDAIVAVNNRSALTREYHTLLRAMVVKRYEAAKLMDGLSLEQRQTMEKACLTFFEFLLSTAHDAEIAKRFETAVAFTREHSERFGYKTNATFEVRRPYHIFADCPPESGRD